MPDNSEEMEPNRYGNPLRIHVEAMIDKFDILRNKYPEDNDLETLYLQWGGLLDFVINPRLEEQGEDGFM